MGATPSGKNARMPMRPMQHRLESQSRTAFQLRMPANWVESRREHDYGLDSDVEIFDGDAATGARFSVQLKSSKAPGSRACTKIKSSSLNYWLAQDVPVLVFHWNSESDSAWYRWAHLIDPSPAQGGKEKFTLTFDAADCWIESSAQEIEKEVRAFRSIRSRQVSLPLPVSFSGTGTIAGVSAGDVIKELRSRVRHFVGVLDLGTRFSHVDAGVEISSGEVRVSLRGESPKVLHYADALPPASPAEVLDRVAGVTSDVILALGVQLGAAGLTDAGADLVEYSLDRSMIARDAALASAVAVLRDGNRSALAIDLLRTVRHSLGDASGASIVAALLDRPASADEADPVLDLLVEWCESDARSGDAASAAPLAFNAGRRVLGIDPQRAVSLMLRASQLDPAYAYRDYWNASIGGAYFLAGDYGQSAHHYLRAVDMGDVAVRLRCGDALLFAGRYEEASALLSEASAEPHDAEYRIKARCVNRLLVDFKIPLQERDSLTAERFCDTDAMSLEVATSALEKDLLCPNALWYLAYLEEHDPERRIDYMLTAVMSEPGNAHAWASVLGNLPWGVDSPWLFDVLLVARRFAGAEIMELLWDESPDVASEMQSVFNSLPHERPEELTVRSVQFGEPGYTIVDS